MQLAMEWYSISSSKTMPEEYLNSWMHSTKEAALPNEIPEILAREQREPR